MLVLFVSQLLFTANLAAQPDSLTVRNAHAMVYHEARGTVLLFGGADEKQVLGDLWEWQGGAWRQLPATGPAPRTFPAMVYDRDRRGVILFGGNRVLFGAENANDTFLNDLWEWDGERWREIKTATPSPRAEAGMVYDRHRKRVVLFGGYRLVEGKPFRLGDTWEWDGKVWQQVSATGPSPRNGAAMVYDGARRRVVLFGGSGASGETWEWNGKNWREIKPALAAGRFNSVMAFDAKYQQIIRFGGWNSQARVADTWRLTGETWQLLEATGPEARNHAAMAYDSKRKRLVLFGGHDGDHIFGDRWEWDGRAWLRAAFTPPRLRVDNGH